MQKAVRQKIKIGFLFNSLGVGGIERQFIAQCRHYDTEQFEIHLFTLYNYPDRVSLYTDLPDHVVVHTFSCLYGRVNLRELRRLFRCLREEKINILVSSMFGPNTISRFFSLFLPYVPIARENNTYTDKKLLKRCVDHMLAHCSPVIVTVSNTVADFAAKQAWIPRKKFQPIHNGIDLAAIEAARSDVAAKMLRSEFSLTLDQRVWLNVARLKPQKNHDLLIDAFALHVQQFPSDVLFIVGGGHEERRLQSKIAERGLIKSIMLTGYRADVFAFYQLADFFILTSDIEGFPNVALEAMAFGLPVLSTNVAGIDEVIFDGKNGYIIERVPAAVCDTMRKIRTRDTNELRVMHSESMATSTKFSIQTTVDLYQKLFIALVKGKTHD